MHPFTRTFAVGLLLTLASTQAPAVEIDEIFRAQDSNGDDALSVEEARAAAPEMFKRIDRNGNGSISADEIAAYTVAENGPQRTAWPAEALAAVAQGTLHLWDNNQDGKVTEQEYADAAVALLLLADTDGDRLVSREELQRFRGEPVAAQ